MPTIVEANLLCIFQGLDSDRWDKARHGHLLRSTRGVLRRMIDFRLCFVNKGCNRVALSLASLASRGVNVATLQLESPPSIAELLVLDCKNIIPI